MLSQSPTAAVMREYDQNSHDVYDNSHNARHVAMSFFSLVSVLSKCHLLQTLVFTAVVSGALNVRLEAVETY